MDFLLWKEKHSLRTSIILIVAAVALINCSISVFASSQNEAGLVLIEGWDIQDVLHEIDKESLLNKQYEFHVHNGGDGSGESIKEIQLIFDPNQDDEIIEDVYWDDPWTSGFQSKQPWTITCRDVPENEGCGMRFKTNIEKTIHLPFSIKREMDNVYFETTGTQIVTMRLLLDSDLEHIHVNIEPMSTPEADVKVLSTSMDYLDRVDEANSWIIYEIPNPKAGKNYILKAELQVTPKEGKVTYIPHVWVEITETELSKESTTGKSISIQTDFGRGEATSSEELTFHTIARKRFGISFQQKSIASKILIEGLEATQAPASALESKELLIDGMEDASKWSIGTGSETKLFLTEDSYYVKEGSKSLKLEYSGRTKGCKECYGVIRLFQGSFSEWKNYEGIRFWVYNPSEETEVEAHVRLHGKTPDGKTSNYFASRYLRTKGWHEIEIPFTDFKWDELRSDVNLPFDLDKFGAFIIEFKSDASSFTAYVDDLKLYEISGVGPAYEVTLSTTATAPPQPVLAPTTRVFSSLYLYGGAGLLVVLVIAFLAFGRKEKVEKIIEREKVVLREIEEILPEKCPGCGAPFKGRSGDACEHCGKVIRAEKKVRRVE